MKISGMGNESYLFLRGIKVNEEISLTDGVSILPLEQRLDINTASKLLASDIDFGVLVIFADTLSAQMKVLAESPKELAIKAWNSLHYSVLLSALFETEITYNFQSTHQVGAITEKSKLSVTNYHLKGLHSETRIIDQKDAVWLENHFKNALKLCDNNPPFEIAIHSLATYRWHSHPSVQLAIIWAGIESLFKIDSEISYRVSLYVAKFLEGLDADKALTLFKETKTLYIIRSKAVHGIKLKESPVEAVKTSAKLLYRLVIKCIETNSLPNTESLVF